MSARAGAWVPRGIGARVLLLAALVMAVCVGALSVPVAAHAETCDQDGVHASFTTVYSTAPPAGYKVTAVTLSGIDPACKGRDVTITLKNGSTTIASVHTVIASDSITIPLSTPSSVDNIGDVDIEIAAGTLTPTPTPTPSPTPSPTPTPTESPTPTPTPRPSPAPTAQPSPSPLLPVVPTLPATIATLPPTLSPTPGPSPTATGTPQPTPTPPLTASTPVPPPAAGPAEPTSTPPPPNEARSAFAEFVPSLRNISTSPATIATNVTLSLVAFLLIVMACAVFNETLEENGPVLTGMLMTALGPLRGVFFRPPPAAIVQRVSALTLLKPVLLLSLIGFIYSALDPNFGWNQTTLALLISLSIGLGFLTFFYEGGKVLVSARIYHGTGTLRIQPLGVAVAILSVIVSRIIAIHPGIVFGFVAGAAVSGNDEREDGQITYLPMVALFIMSMVAFVLIDPLRSFSDNSAQWYGVIPETVAVTLFIGGIEGLLFNLLPLEFMEGKEVWNWSRFAWLTIALPVGFVFFHLLVNRSDAYESSLQQTSVQVLFAACGVFLVLSFGFWLACRFWLPKHVGATAEHAH